VIWRVYWTLAEIGSTRQKSKSSKTIATGYAKRASTLLVDVIIIAQLLSVQILPFHQSLLSILTGITLVTCGIAISISARRTLGANWAHRAEYQIKQRQTLVTQGIYAYIRHPIYTARLLMIVGAELVASSLLVVPVLLFVPLVMYSQAKREEDILAKEFGEKYKKYTYSTRMFLPLVW
jgi:protein-S-isoprenylcysteine O-methyltransferase Ste14